MRRRILTDLAVGSDAAWFQPALELLRALPRATDPRLARLIAPGHPVLIARAPGRLDVMGGIADYSGSVVLELPLARSTFAFLQAREDSAIELASLREDRVHFFSSSLEALTDGGLVEPGRLAAHARDGGEEWAAYVLGVVQLSASLAGHGNAHAGFNLLIHSDVPEGKGVSSSAALEVAAMTVVAAHLGLEMDASAIATACQWVENHVVGAPCGIMDQLTSALGRQDRLLRLRCQPAQVEGQLEVPPDYRFYGIDSGVRHAVSGADYGTVRAAAFMGYRILAAVAGLPVVSEGDTVRVHDTRWHGYLANVSPAELRAMEMHLPERLIGAAFLSRYGGHTDPVTRIRPEWSYPVRQATRHPVLENARVERFAALLEALPASPVAAIEMGRLMYESHESYGACGLGSEGTDRLVAMVREAGEAAGLFGAKITGGGSGGTVAVLGRRDAESAVRKIAADYGEAVGVRAEVFAESGPGAEVTGVGVGMIPGV